MARYKFNHSKQDFDDQMQIGTVSYVYVLLDFLLSCLYFFMGDGSTKEGVECINLVRAKFQMDHASIGWERVPNYLTRGGEDQ